MLLNEESKVDPFIKGLRSKQYRSHFLITKPFTMKEVRRTVIHITRKGQWIYITSRKRYKSDSTSSSCSDSDSNSDSSISASASLIKKDFIKMIYSSYSKKKHAGISQRNKSLGTSYLTTTTSTSKQESSEIDSLIKQFGENENLHCWSCY